MQRIAILDDYQDVALSCADWGSLPGPPEITVFNEHIARHETLAAAYTSQLTCPLSSFIVFQPV